MATLADLQLSISKRLIDPTNTAVDVSDITQGINDSIAYWKFRRFWFNEVSDTATLTAQSPSFPYPSDFLVPSTSDDGFNIQYGNCRYPLIKITQQEYDNGYISNGYGLPRFYARIGSSEYQCYPIPDQNYVVGRHYLKDYVALSAGSDTNDFTVSAPRLITLWTLGNLTTELRQDVDMGTYYRQAANDEYRNIRVLTDKKNGTGTLSLDSMLID